MKHSQIFTQYFVLPVQLFVEKGNIRKGCELRSEPFDSGNRWFFGG
jgi:hypothetical protein